MLVEIGLMQPLALFRGYPVYSVGSAQAAESADAGSEQMAFLH